MNYNEKIMNKTVIIDKETFIVLETEFNKVPHQEFNNLNILESLGLFERLVSLINKLKYDDTNLICLEISHGGFVPIKACSNYRNVYILNKDETYNYNIIKNLEKRDILNVGFIDSIDRIIDEPNFIFSNSTENEFTNISSNTLVIISKKNIDDNNFITYSLTNTEFFVSVRMSFHEIFLNKFNTYILTIFDENKKPSYLLNYDNLIHLSMIVKNAGDNFEDILIKNFPYFDRWTIIDTGSTDNTVEIIKKVLVGQKEGELYQEPFTNFRDSRNRCLDLCGTESKYILILDDTYILQNDLRLFFNVIRGDQFADTFSLFIKSNDTEYGSNRIIKSNCKNIRYIYKIHEVLNPNNNINVIIPMECCHIFDYRSEYMEKRTMERKKYDLKILHEIVDEEPNDPRAFYYLGQTYSLLERYESALEFFMKRVEHPVEGFVQEKIDACFEAARLCNFQLKKPWSECEKLYLKAYKMDESRPESLYFIGIHYYLEGDFKKAYEFMKKAFFIGYPIHCQYALKPTLYFFYLPKFLSEICFIVNDLKLGIDASKLFLEKNDAEKNSISLEYQTVKCWNKIFTKLKSLESSKYSLNPVSISSKPILVFVADGGFEKWKGSDILIKGTGGSETFIIEMTKYIRKSDIFDIYVFCNCSVEEKFEEVYYLDLKNYPSFLKNNKIDTCVISRYPEYLPMTYISNVENVHLILHDLIPNGEVIINNDKLKNVICLTDWHSKQFSNMFPNLKEKTTFVNYGIDKYLFELKSDSVKIPHKFIYSSFANRGLLQLLQIWPDIIKKFPKSTLHIHCDIDNTWLLSINKEEIDEIKILIEKYYESVFYKGWTSKKELAKSFQTADIWFYPCTFLETFCLTALEAAISKTFVITSDLGALQETVGDRGIMIPGDPRSLEWKNKAIQTLFSILEDENLKNSLVEKNYMWARKMSWKRKSNDLLKILSSEKNKLLLEEEDDDFVFIKHPEQSQDKRESYLDIKILDYFKFKTNGKPSKILEIGNNIISKKKVLSTLVEYSNNFEVTSLIEEDICDNNSFSNMDNINLIKTPDILTEILERDEKKYDFIILSDKFDDVLCFSIASICFKNILKKDGIIGFIKSPMSKKNIDLFIQKNKSNINILQNNEVNLFVEKI